MLGQEGDRWRGRRLTGSENGGDLDADLGWLRRDDVAVDCGSPELEVGLEPGVSTGGFHRR